MKVVEVITNEGKLRYMVVNQQGVPIPEILKFLKYKDNSGAARNTLRTLSYHLKLFYEFLEQEELQFQDISIDHMASFLRWLKDPYRYGKVRSIKPVPPSRKARTINAIINSVIQLYDYLLRREDTQNMVSKQLKRHIRGSQRGFKDFLFHINKDKYFTKNLLKIPVPKEKPKTLQKEEISQLMNHCHNLRDRFLIQLLWESSMRIGEALGLWLEDFEIDAQKIHIRDRGELENHAELKTPCSPRSIDVSSELINQYLEYIAMIHTEEVDTNFVFIKLSGLHRFQPLEYQDVVSLFQRLKRKTGIHCTPHMLRHTSLTELRRSGWRDEHLMKRAGHAHVQTTIQMYVHPTDEDIRRDWEKVEHKMRLKKGLNK